MSFERKTIALRGDTPGATTDFTYYVIGPKDAPEKVHLQAALHADEHPGTMVLQTCCRCCARPTTKGCSALASR